LTCSC